MVSAPSAQRFYIHSDSTLVLNTWGHGNIGKKTERTMDKIKRNFIKETGKLRRSLAKSGRVVYVKVPGEKNPADLGYHR